jgi:hypothetical protein
MKSRRIVRTLPLLSVTLLLGQTQAQRQLVADQNGPSVYFSTGGHVPRWTGNRLVGCDPCEGSPILWTVDRLGHQDSVVLKIPEASYTAEYDVAAGPDGSLAAVGLAINGGSRMGTFIAWISPDRQRQVITRVWPYAPQVVTIAPDGTIWTVGAVMNDSYREVNPNVLRHYTPSGQLLASTWVRGPHRSTTGLYNVSGASTLMASNDRIGWLTMACQYFEYSFDAVELGRYNCPNGIAKSYVTGGIALSSANDVLIAVKQIAPLAPLQLDRASNSWKPVPVSQDTGITHSIAGFDGLTLVTRATGGSTRRYTLSDALSAGGQ